MRNPKANEIAQKRLAKAIRDGTDYVLVTRIPVADYCDHGDGPFVQATYVGTAHTEQMLHDALAVKRYIKTIRR